MRKATIYDIVDAEYLKKLYWGKGKTQREIAKIIGCSQMHVRRLMAINGIKARTYKDNKTPVPKGSHLLPEHAEAISKALKGKSRPERRGENHHNWKGGISRINRIERGRIEYVTWRGNVLRRDNHICQMPNCMSSVNLEAHHVKSFAKNHDLRYEVTNGITLCHKCHMSISGEPQKFLIPYFKYRIQLLTIK